ncbi:hypothetical protein [Rhodomicrobium vannielii]|nr:hypothetical protein [Rhodomicrobium vannielii]
MTVQRLYLGRLAIVPSADIGGLIALLTQQPKQERDNFLLTRLGQIFALPPAAERTAGDGSDCAVDIFLSARGGSYGDLTLGPIGLPLLLRTKIELRARLYRLDADKTLQTYLVTERTGWGEYLQKFSARSYFRSRPVFDLVEMDTLLNRASHRLLKSLVRSGCI